MQVVACDVASGFLVCSSGAVCPSCSYLPLFRTSVLFQRQQLSGSTSSQPWRPMPWSLRLLLWGELFSKPRVLKELCLPGSLSMHTPEVTQTSQQFVPVVTVLLLSGLLFQMP